MKVVTSQPFRVVYSLFNHQFLGYLIAPFVVQINSKGELTFSYQAVSAKTAKEFQKNTDETDLKIIKYADAIQPEYIVSKFYNKRIHPNEFFLKVYDKTKGDRNLQTLVEEFVDSRIGEILKLIQTHQKPFFVMGTDGNPTWKPIQIAPNPVSVLFHFVRNEKETHYFPTLLYEGKKLTFQFKDARILCNQRAWLLLENTLYHFKQNIDGNKLRPFLQKWYINVPRNVEENYFQKFVLPLIASFDVSAKGSGFEIISESFAPQAILRIGSVCRVAENNLFEAESETLEQEVDFLFELFFRYGSYVFPAENDHKPAFVNLEKHKDGYIFRKIFKNKIFEQNTFEFLKNKNLEIFKGRLFLPIEKALQWLEKNAENLPNEQIVLEQNFESGKKYFFGKSFISLKTTEKADWLDLKAIIRFGEYEVPFIKLRPYILGNIKEFPLPNGEIALIPDEWFSRYGDIFYLAQNENNEIRLEKYHLPILQEIAQNQEFELNIQEKLKNLLSQEIQDYPLPQGLKVTLRNYQKVGFNWLCILAENRLGGFLADDMGLGKTLQTLALLQSEKEKKATKPSLVIMPTSLLYNWEVEAKKFTPFLQITTYTGSQREQKLPFLHKFDVVFTSYGVVRMDIEALAKISFNYVILDESQAIKNPQSNISQAVSLLKAEKRLLLTGTPVENSLLDLWSQMNFANPHLLGDQSFFKKNFLRPIEKENDAKRLEKLQKIIRPFILRRTKEQVATELPPKMEHIAFCEMSAEQAKIYEETKSRHRNQILEQIEKFGVAKSQFIILKALTELRQIANHPQLVNTDFQGISGKMEDVCYKLQTLLAEGKKVLIFSQFVKHLAIFRRYLEENNIRYAYLDGATLNRQEQVNDFQQNPKTAVFLISLKAGGVGLNLTAAEYVFLLDPWWNPAVEAQAIDRAYRIGQTKNVIAYKFITHGSIEEKILLLQERKKTLSQNLINTEESIYKHFSAEDIDFLLG
jgi:SNF2 family DNA or RNA helicase